MIGSSLRMLLQMVLGNPMVQFAVTSLPEPLRSELNELRALALAGDLALMPRKVHIGQVRTGQSLRGVAVALGAVRGGTVLGSNLLRGPVYEGAVRGVNVLAGDVHGGQVTGVNALVGDVHGGTVSALNLLLGDVHGGNVSRTAVVVGNVHEGSVSAELLVGRILGGDVQVRLHKEPAGDRPGDALSETEATEPGRNRSESPGPE